jgi:hypothetical protein
MCYPAARCAAGVDQAVSLATATAPATTEGEPAAVLRLSIPELPQSSSRRIMASVHLARDGNVLTRWKATLACVIQPDKIPGSPAPVSDNQPYRYAA